VETEFQRRDWADHMMSNVFSTSGFPGMRTGNRRATMKTETTWDRSLLSQDSENRRHGRNGTRTSQGKAINSSKLSMESVREMRGSGLLHIRQGSKNDASGKKSDKLQIH
jgi:hypothetical protein